MKSLPRVTFVCVGPGDPGLVTLRAKEALLRASRVHLVWHEGSGNADLLARVIEGVGVARDKIDYGPPALAASVSVASASAAKASAVNASAASASAANAPNASDLVVAHSSFPPDIQAASYLEKDLIAGGARVIRVPGISPAAARAATQGAPLEGKRILLLRAKEQAADAESLFFARGALPLTVSALDIGAPPDPARLVRAAREASSYAFIVFTSANGVRRFFNVLYTDMGRDARALAPAKIAVIGPKTADALIPYGVRADLVAKEFVGESLARDLAAAIGPVPARILMPRALVARDVVPESLAALGHSVDVVPAYETRGPSEAERTELHKLFVNRAIDAVALTSSSTVTHVFEALGAGAPALFANVVVASIGPVTTETAQKLGLRVDVTAATFTLQGLADALESHFGN